MAYGTIVADKITTSDGYTLGGSGATMKNRIINGAMVIDQRNNGAANTPSGSGTVYNLDRWSYVYSAGSKITVQQNSGSVTPPDGFSKYLGANVASSYSVTSGDYFYIRHVIEGNNIADLAWGSSDAKTVTLSFWVRSSITGTYAVKLGNEIGRAHV